MVSSKDFPGRTFVLGAGFSAGAGVPLTAPLLTTAMEIFAAECPGIFQRVRNYAGDLDWNNPDNPNFATISFSELCTHLDYVELRELAGGERWSDDGCREKLALRFYLAKAIALATPVVGNVPDLYVQFADQLTDKDIVLSLNWDCLLEAAILQAGKSYSYAFEAGKIRIAKLHGSINWLSRSPRSLQGPANTLNWSLIDPTEKVVPQKIWSTERLHNPLLWDRYEPLGEVKPFLILPGYGKAYEARQNAAFWYKPEFSFFLARSVYIVGLSLCADDHFLRSFFLNTLPLPEKRHVVINPSESARQDYAFLTKGDVTFIDEPFDLKHVAMMRRDI